MLLAGFLGAGPVAADEVQLQNGDRYVGQVLSLDANTLTLRNDVLGTVSLPRGKVSSITLGSKLAGPAVPVNPPAQAGRAAASAPSTNEFSDALASLPALAGGSNTLQQLQAHLLGTGGAEANAKFREMLAGYLSGKLTVSDIRAQAQAAAEQLRKVKSELGEEETGSLNGYLTILEKFLGATPPPEAASPSSTNSPSSPTKPAGSATGK